MKPCGKFNITIDQFANFYWPVSYKDISKNPIDLTDYTVAMQVRRTVEDTETVLDLSSEGDDPAITIDGPAGLITINVPPEVTAELESGFEGVYDIKITSPDDFVERILEGQAFVSGAVTRPPEE